MTEQPVGPRCGNNPNVRLTDGDRKAVADFKARLALQAAIKPYVDAAAWVGGDPLMEVIAAAVWEHCRTEGTSLVTDDPRNIAAVAAAVARAAEAQQQEPDDTDLTEPDIDRMMAAGVPVQIVTGPPDAHGAGAQQQPDTGAPFATRVLEIFAKADSHGDLLWRIVDGQPEFAANVSDVFAWGGADAEDITAETLPVLEQAFTDLAAIRSTEFVADLYAARLRKMRPQGAAYPGNTHPSWREVSMLFDACGPERELGLGNPKPAPAHAPPAPVAQQPAAEDTCRPVEIDGEIIRVRGAAEMSEESRAALAEVIAAAKRRYLAEHPEDEQQPAAADGEDTRPSPTAVLLATRCDTCQHTLNWHRNDVGCTVPLCVCGRFQPPTEEPQP
ncbi:hypothetical protein [Streptomyces sp. NPDC002573]|uniref:hypothetical protein n=1 Tax=Streptomyces sp. NPDC002573 TaxID=3364651 RepID=UPI0036A8619A